MNTKSNEENEVLSFPAKTDMTQNGDSGVQIGTATNVSITNYYGKSADNTYEEEADADNKLIKKTTDMSKKRVIVSCSAFMFVGVVIVVVIAFQLYPQSTLDGMIIPSQSATDTPGLPTLLPSPTPAPTPTTTPKPPSISDSLISDFFYSTSIQTPIGGSNNLFYDDTLFTDANIVFVCKTQVMVNSAVVSIYLDGEFYRDEPMTRHLGTNEFRYAANVFVEGDWMLICTVTDNYGNTETAKVSFTYPFGGAK